MISLFTNCHSSTTRTAKLLKFLTSTAITTKHRFNSSSNHNVQLQIWIQRFRYANNRIILSKGLTLSLFTPFPLFLFFFFRYIYLIYLFGVYIFNSLSPSLFLSLQQKYFFRDQPPFTPTLSSSRFDFS